MTDADKISKLNKLIEYAKTTNCDATFIELDKELYTLYNHADFHSIDNKRYHSGDNKAELIYNPANYYHVLAHCVYEALIGDCPGIVTYLIDKRMSLVVNINWSHFMIVVSLFSNLFPKSMDVAMKRNCMQSLESLYLSKYWIFHDCNKELIINCCIEHSNYEFFKKLVHYYETEYKWGDLNHGNYVPPFYSYIYECIYFHGKHFEWINDIPAERRNLYVSQNSTSSLRGAVMANNLGLVRQALSLLDPTLSLYLTDIMPHIIQLNIFLLIYNFIPDQNNKITFISNIFFVGKLANKKDIMDWIQNSNEDYFMNNNPLWITSIIKGGGSFCPGDVLLTDLLYAIRDMKLTVTVNHINLVLENEQYRPYLLTLLYYHKYTYNVLQSGIYYLDYNDFMVFNDKVYFGKVDKFKDILCAYKTTTLSYLKFKPTDFVPDPKLQMCIRGNVLLERYIDWKMELIDDLTTIHDIPLDLCKYFLTA
jgi:hypothetical protein